MRLTQIFIILFFCMSSTAMAQFDMMTDDDIELGSDIFSDFSQDITEKEMAEDERFYRYARFFSFAIGLGGTFYDGNRGAAYTNDPPTISLALNYFMSFRVSLGLGFTFSKHHFFIDGPTVGFPTNAPGLINVNALRVFWNYRYYVDTSNLGTAITYATPYFTGRIEYWYLTEKFEDQSALEDVSGGGLGFGVGGGFEFPIELKSTYIGVEFLFHGVNYHDKFTQKYKATTGSITAFDDLNGNGYSTLVYYVLSW